MRIHVSLLVLLGLLLPAFAMAGNKADAQARCKWLEKNRSPIKCKVDKRVCPSGYYADRKYKKGGKNWSACVSKASKSKWNKKQAQKACNVAAKSGLKGCTVFPKHICPAGWFHIKHVRGEGENHSACLMRGRQLIEGISKVVKDLKELASSTKKDLGKVPNNL